MTMHSNRLRFIEITDHYSIYRDADGDDVFLAHGTAKRLTDEFDWSCLHDYFDEWRRSVWYPGFIPTQIRDKDDFITWLHGQVIDDNEEIVDIEWCSDCHYPEDPDDTMTTVHDSRRIERRVCDECAGDNYYHCVDCEERFAETTTTLTDEEVCGRCRDHNWTYCDHCEGYRSDRDWEHDHEQDNQDNGCCEAPRQVFAVPNNGDVLANDQTTTVSLAVGTITDVGLGSIAQLLRRHGQVDSDETRGTKFEGLSYTLHALGDQWMTSNGTFTKRLSRHAYKTFGLKIEPDLLSEIGNIASNHSRGDDYLVSVTRDLNQSARHYAHGESCWWSSHSESRCALKSNGGFGLRTWEYGNVQGRAWVMPVRLSNGAVIPTFNSLTPDGYLVFNGYGNLEEYAQARVMAQMASLSYRRVDFECSPMYVNNDTAYLVATQEVLEDSRYHVIEFDLDEHASLHHYEPMNFDQMEMASA